MTLACATKEIPMKTLTLLATTLTLLTSNAFSQDANDSELAEKIKTAMNAEIRTEAEIARDANRKPLETLQFFGLEPDMKIVELIPGGGWYTKILYPAVEERGEYYAAILTDSIKENLGDHPDFSQMNIVAEDHRFWREEGARYYSLELDSLEVTDADMVLTFRNYHNLDEAGRKTMNDAAFNALKSGGVYAVVDHTKRHMETETPANRRRVDPVLAIKEIQDAGFEFVDYSTLHYRADDELRYEVGARSVTGNTDRWTLKFIKPE